MLAHSTNRGTMHRTKRSACDRCRDQKLRCRRENGAISSCVRCVRAEVACVTSSSKPVGRPVRGSLYNSPGHSRLWAPTDTHPRSYEHSLDTATPSNGSQQNIMFSNVSSAVDAPFPYNDSTISSRSESWDTLMSAMQMDGFDMGMSDMASLLEPLPETDILPEVLHQSKLQPTDPYPLTPRTENNALPEERSPDPFLLLSKLNKDLYEWMLAIQQNDCPPPWRLNMSLESHDSNGNTDDSESPVNMTASFLRILSDFISVLKLLAGSDTSKQDGAIKEKPDKTSSFQTAEALHIDNTSTSFGTSSPGMPIILMVMTTYLLLLRVFNIIISRLCFVLETMPDGAANIQYDSGVQLGGLPLPQGLLHLKLIIQVLEHQLVLIETSLGLPAEYRIHRPARLSEGQQGSLPGLFNCESHRSLLKVVMTQIDQRDEKSQSDILHLRQNFAKLKELLQGSV